MSHRTLQPLKPIAALALVALLSACATNPVTGKKEIAMISEAQEIQLGRENDQQVQASIGLYDDPDLQQYVQRIGAKLAAESERPNLPWTFRVVDDASVNAFALPGGFIYVTRGILTHFNSEAELAAVLGHEIGHVTARHSVSQMSKQQLAGLGLSLAMIFSPAARPYGDLAQTGLGVLFLKYSRDDERQADDLGYQYMLNEGYDPRQMAEVFEMLDTVSRVNTQGRLPNWLASHPEPAARRQTVEAKLAQAGPLGDLTIARASFLDRIDGVVFGENPREGFFEGAVFHHPELRFRLQFPQGWKTQNTKQAVTAISPNKDALVGMTLENARSLQDAAQTFFGQQGIQQGEPWRREIGSFRALSYTFGAQTQNGVLRGVVAWVEDGNRIYRMLGYTSEQRWPQYDRILADTLASFDRERDSRVLDVQPARVDVVKLRQGMSLPAFAREYPSSVPVETLALINHVDSRAQLGAGDVVKRVTGGTGR